METLLNHSFSSQQIAWSLGGVQVLTNLLTRNSNPCWDFPVLALGSLRSVHVASSQSYKRDLLKPSFERGERVGGKFKTTTKIQCFLPTTGSSPFPNSETSVLLPTSFHSSPELEHWSYTSKKRVSTGFHSCIWYGSPSSSPVMLPVPQRRCLFPFNLSPVLPDQSEQLFMYVHAPNKSLGAK